MVRFMDTLKARDFQTHARLQEQDLKPQFFAFRWLTLMLSQEFALPDVLRIWDSLLSDETRCDLLIEVCVAMIMLVREKIMVQEFPENMKLLQVRRFSAYIPITLPRHLQLSELPLHRCWDNTHGSDQST